MRTLLFAAASIVAAAAGAQGGSREKVLEPQSKAPPVPFRSALEGYKPYADQEPGDWRKANEEVRRQAAKPAAKADPAHTGHGSHK